MRQVLLITLLSIVLGAGGVRAQTPGSYAQAIEQAVAAYNAGQFEQARAHFAEAHALRPNARTWRGLGTSDFELARWSDAIAELSEALADTRSPLTDELRVQTEAQLATARASAPPPPTVDGPSVEPPPAPDTVPVAAEPLPTVAAEPTPELPRWKRLGALRTGALASLLVSVTGFALATGYGVRSIKLGDRRDEYCDASGACRDARGVEAGNDARHAGNLATVGWVLGSVGLAGAGVLLWLDRAQGQDQPRAALRISPSAIAFVGTL